MSKWIPVCTLDNIYEGTGVCALIEDKQIAIFRPTETEQVYALDNMDPFARSNVLSRGIICEHKAQLWVASPIKKQRFNLADGRCFEDPEVALTTYKTRVQAGKVEVQVN